MIETRQSVVIGLPLAHVWNHVRDIRRWAQIMPGYRECDIVDEDNSRWTLKVGVGGLVRTVHVLVRVEEWAGPDRVDFTFRLQGDPVQGRGSYHATPSTANTTEIGLHIRVEGSGPMAPMWEAMGAPLLPKFASAFAEQLRDDIEAARGPSMAAMAEGPGVAPPRDQGFLARMVEWVRRLVRRLRGSMARPS